MNNNNIQDNAYKMPLGQGRKVNRPTFKLMLA